MCEIVKIHINPIHHNHLVMTEQVEDLDINHITGVSTAPLMYKEIDGVIYSLTPEVIVCSYSNASKQDIFIGVQRVA